MEIVQKIYERKIEIQPGLQHCSHKFTQLLPAADEIVRLGLNSRAENSQFALCSATIDLELVLAFECHN